MERGRTDEGEDIPAIKPVILRLLLQLNFRRLYHKWTSNCLCKIYVGMLGLGLCQKTSGDYFSHDLENKIRKVLRFRKFEKLPKSLIRPLPNNIYLTMGTSVVKSLLTQPHNAWAKQNFEPSDSFLLMIHPPASRISVTSSESSSSRRCRSVFPPCSTTGRLYSSIHGRG